MLSQMVGDAIQPRVIAEADREAPGALQGLPV